MRLRPLSSCARALGIPAACSCPCLHPCARVLGRAEASGRAEPVPGAHMISAPAPRRRAACGLPEPLAGGWWPAHARTPCHGLGRRGVALCGFPPARAYAGLRAQAALLACVRPVRARAGHGLFVAPRSPRAPAPRAAAPVRSCLAPSGCRWPPSGAFTLVPRAELRPLAARAASMAHSRSRLAPAAHSQPRLRLCSYLACAPPGLAWACALERARGRARAPWPPRSAVRRPCASGRRPPPGWERC